MKNVLTVLLLILIANQLKATLIFPPNDLGEMAQFSELVVYGTVLSNINGDPYANNFQINQVIKGNNQAGDVISLLEYGGMDASGRQFIVSGDVDFQVGESYLLFLGAVNGGYRTNFMALSVYLEATVNGTNLLAHPGDLMDIEFIQPLNNGLNAAFETNVLLPYLSTLVQGQNFGWDINLAGTYYSPGTEQQPNGEEYEPNANNLAPCPNDAPCHCATLFGPPGASQTKFEDNNFTVCVAGGSQTDPSNPNNIADLQTAIGAMNGMTGINISYTGVDAACNPGCASGMVADDVLTCAGGFGNNCNKMFVFFDDPCMQIPDVDAQCTGVLGIGGHYAGGTHMDVCGDTWQTACNPYFVMNNFPGCTVNQNDYIAVLIHEMLHAVGVGHHHGGSAFTTTTAANNACGTGDITHDQNECSGVMNPVVCLPTPPTPANNFSITALDNDCTDWMYNITDAVACDPPIADSTAPPAVVASESTCPDGMTLMGGVIDPPAMDCPAGSTLEYTFDNGTTWSTAIPTYDQTLTVTVSTRCVCDSDPADVSLSSTVTTVPGMCGAVVDCGIIAGEPAMPTATVCNTELASVDVTMIFADPGPAGTPSLVQNYAVTNPATGDLITISNMATLDLSSLDVGDEACVQAVAYTQETLDAITAAVDGVTQFPGSPVPAFGMLDLSGFLNGLNGVFEAVGFQFTAADIQGWCETQTLTIPFSQLPGGLIPDLVLDLMTLIPPSGFCCDFSNSDYCLTVEDCLQPCDPGCANNMLVQIESIEIVDPIAVMGETVVFPPSITDGCAGTGGFDAAPGDSQIELDIMVNGFALPEIPVDGGTAATTTGPWGGYIAVGMTACDGTTVDAGASIIEDDTATGPDDLTDNATQTFDIGGGTFTACGGAIVITYSVMCGPPDCTAMCANCAECDVMAACQGIDLAAGLPVIPTEVCSGASADICLTLIDAAEGLVVTGTIDGAPVSLTGTAGATPNELCVSITAPANETCGLVDVNIMIDAIQCTDGTDYPGILGGATLLDDLNGAGFNPIAIPVYPTLTVNATGDGACGDLVAELVAADGTVCAMAAGSPLTCATDGDVLMYDFTADVAAFTAVPADCPLPTLSGTLTCGACTGPMGCTDPCAPNYDAAATVDDGSCMDYDDTCNADCTAGPFGGIWDAATCACINETVPVNGCTDPAADNYDATANCDDGSCIIPGECNFSVGVSAFTCNDGGTMEDPADDTADITFVVLSNGSAWTSDVAIGGVMAGGDGMMLTETGVAAGTVITVTFTSDDDPTCTFTLNYTVPDCTVQIPTLSQWGLITLALLLMVIGSLRLGFSSVAFQKIRKK